jgi:uncharacterized protein YbbC (DUF1343 family)/CubicO group peptidase (beta-lactamase class C family)
VYGNTRIFISLFDYFFLSLRLCVSAVLLATAAHTQGLPVAAPQTVGMNPSKLAQIDALVEQDIKDKKLPGAVVLVGHKGKIVYRKAYGNRSLVPTVEKMTVDTIFDVASLTKPVATATSIMILVEQGKLRLNDTVGKYIPEIQDEQAKRITIQQLLTHTSGYAPDFDLKEKWTGREGMLQALYKEKLRNSPGTRFVYSDIGFIVLGEIVERFGQSIKPPECPELYAATPTSLDIQNCEEQFVLKNVLAPAGMKDSRFFRLSGTSVQIVVDDRQLIEAKVAPTENIKGQNSYLGGTFEGDVSIGEQVLRGVVHDPTAFRMGGVAGHAGLFSTADDLARFCQMLLNGGAVPKSEPPAVAGGLSRPKVNTAGPRNNRQPPATAGGSDRRILSAETISRMTAPHVVSETGETRGLGWDINSSFSSNRGELFPLGSFGHTGFTGTSIWIDRVSQTFVVFLSNRVHPDGKGDVTPLRAKISTVVASAIEDSPIEAYRLAESIYSSQVAAQLPAFIERKRLSNINSQLSTIPKTVTVLNGIDVLEKNGFKELQSLKIGLVTNHTGRNLAGKQTIDVLKEAPGVKLVALFAPEHGIRGELDTEKIDDTKDERTGLQVYSIYKDGMRRPKPEQLKDLDAIVYDIQDVGARFYTYTATLRNVMEEAARAGKPVIILDRPNPVNGIDVEGTLAEEDKLNFIAAHTIPVRYGLTIGELGQMMNAERRIGADVRVVKMENWSRSMWFDETGQTWINPSPNMRSLNEATLYPGIGLLEVTNVSVGRGTHTPFEVLGAPWIDGRRFADHLNKQNIKGVRFVPIRFKPNASVYKDEDLSGINIIVTDRSSFDSVRTGFEIAAALRKLYPNDWQVDRYARLLVNGKMLSLLQQGADAAALSAEAQKDVDAFKKRREPFLLYK